MADFAQMEALAIHEASLCRQCGRPLDVCRDPEAIVSVDSDVCMYTRATALQKRRDAAKHPKEEPNPNTPFWSDGLSYQPRPATEEEIEQALRPARLRQQRSRRDQP